MRLFRSFLLNAAACLALIAVAGAVVVLSETNDGQKIIVLAALAGLAWFVWFETKPKAAE